MFRFLIITVVAAAMADPHEGACPEVKPVENFNITAYQGVWYGISKIPIESEGKGQCALAEYTVDGDTIKVKNSHVNNGVQTILEGTAKFAADANNAAKLTVAFKFGGDRLQMAMYTAGFSEPPPPGIKRVLSKLRRSNLYLVTESPLLVLVTDYTSYSVAYNCKYDEKTKAHKDQAWIMSRSNKLEGDAKTAVDTFLKEHAKIIDAAKLVQTDFSEEACKFTSTSFMTEQVAKP